MAYIYKITNQINQKSYIGKTEYTNPQKRWSQHKKDADNPSRNHRALYKALNKYGIENFSFEIIEETNKPEDRERYYIQLYNTYHDGYNETLGGDGASYLELPEQDICDFYISSQCLQYTVDHFGHDKETIKKVLHKYNIPIFDLSTTFRKTHSQAVVQIDPKTDKIINIFSSVAEAELATGNGKHIGAVCSGNRKTTKGFKWKYLKDLT